MDEAGGSPLALVELPRRLGPGQLRGIVPLPDQLPLGRRLERLFADRLAGLTPAAERVLLLAAPAGPCSVEGTASWLRAAAALAHGRDEEAYQRLAALMPPGELPPGLPWFHLPFLDLVEAAVRTGRRAEAVLHEARRAFEGLGAGAWAARRGSPGQRPVARGTPRARGR